MLHLYLANMYIDPDVSSKLGEYMVKGWALTDATCTTPTCHGVPLMRSPKHELPAVYHCANCNGPQRPNDSSIQSSSSSIDSSSTYDSHLRLSTPPTEISSTLSSPTFAPPIETEEAVRQRELSDQASAEIGKRILKGWSMLDEECPNIRCGISLVSPPKVGEESNPRKECVICGTVYVTDVSEAWQRLIPAPFTMELEPSSGVAKCVSSGSGTQGSHNKGNAITGDIPSQFSPILPAPESSQLTIKISKCNQDLKSSGCLHTSVPSNNLVTVHSSAQALKVSLDAMSQRLAQICDNAGNMDVPSIASAACAINKVAQALSQVRQLEDLGQLYDKSLES